MKKRLYKLYRKLNQSVIVCTATFTLYRFYNQLKNVHVRRCGWNHVEGFKSTVDSIENKNLKNIKIAFICDDMTYSCFSKECNASFLTPHNWKTEMERQKPDLFFCESTWMGLKEFGDCWRGEIYRNHKVLYDNRRVLLEILDYCHKEKIPTVFWNKEDPMFFDPPNYDFSDTAIRFDHIFTTCQECIEKYRAKGHNSVHLLMFGVSPELYNPINSLPKEKKAVFAGSWDGVQEERCCDMERVFDYVLKQGIPLEIYDRNYGKNLFNKTYPQKYQEYVKPAIPYEQVCEVTKRAQYAITINSIKDSETMFARRAFEIAMCNTTIISNESQGIRTVFENRIWFAGEPFDRKKEEKIRKQNLEEILLHHTNAKRLYQICETVGIMVENSNMKVGIILWDSDEDACKKLEEQLAIQPDCHMRVVGWKAGKDILWNSELNNDDLKLDYYYCVRSPEEIDINTEYMMAHFSYLDDSVVGIERSNIPYLIDESETWNNLLVPQKNLSKLLHHKKIKKYTI